MKTKFKNLAVGAVLASSMILSTGTAMAWDYGSRYDRRGGYDQRALAEAQNQLNYDLQHKASRKKLAQDQAVIDQILAGGNARYDRRGGYDRRALEDAKNQLNYDLQHKASRKKLAEDQAVIDQILAGERGYAQRDNGWWRW
jgi:chloramphenicol 3-O-phosphotransferase